MAPFVSIIIPNRNGAATIGACLRAAFATQYEPFEVIVVDDNSTDNSIAVIEDFPCRLVRLGKHAGASGARNAGAAQAGGELLFFTDADCLVEENTLSITVESFQTNGSNVILGGTYSPEPYDRGFFNRFQAIFVNHSETRRAGAVDYIAGHGMAIDAGTYRQSGGFAETFLPVAEDVEFSHRLRDAGMRLIIDPRIQVRHFFRFSLIGSLANAAFKSTHWMIYLIQNRRLLVDSGTASTMLKINVLLAFINLVLIALGVFLGEWLLLVLILPSIMGSLWVSRGLMSAFYTHGGILFTVGAGTYYLFVYPYAVGLGGIAGIVRFFALGHRQQRKG